VSNPRKIIVVTGPARSGKSEWAEKLAQQSQKSVIYLATSHVDSTDVEWLGRIEQHRQRRPPTWQTLEVPRDLVGAIAQIQGDYCLLVDSLGTWVANFLEYPTEAWEQQVGELLGVLLHTPLDVILVAEETGWGVIPSYKSGRLFRDRLGFLVRQVAQVANLTYLVTGGYILNLTQLGEPLG
jgi:adenosylcobinamide kinase/adenosylcobinamide-phosphate guanylyltransferase